MSTPGTTLSFALPRDNGLSQYPFQENLQPSQEVKLNPSEIARLAQSGLSRIHTAKTSLNPLFLSPLTFLSLAGCGESSPPPDPDAGPNNDCETHLGMDQDNDGDGFTANRDCNDCDPNLFPLEEGQRVFIEDNATICPGTYRNAKITILRQNEIFLEGPGVTLVNDEDLNEDEEGKAGILVKFSHNITVSGFNFSGNTNALVLATSTGCNIKNISAEAGNCEPVLALNESTGNSLQEVIIKSPGIQIKIDGTTNSSRGGRNSLQQSQFGYLSTNCPSRGLFIYTQNNEFHDNQLMNLPFHLLRGGGNTLSGNRIMGNRGIESPFGLLVQSNNNQISENTISNNKIGINIGNQASNNNIISNDLSGNDVCIQTSTTAGENTLTDNTCS